MSVYARRLSASLAANTNAVANTLSNHTIVAAPGAGLRFRLFGFGVRKTDLGGGFAAAFGTLGVGDVGLEASSTGFSPAIPGDTEPLGDVGIPLAENSALTGYSMSSVAATPIEMFAIYSIENV